MTSSAPPTFNCLPTKRSRRARRLRFEELEDRCLLTTFLVTNTNDSGAGSLRQAILDGNASTGADMIHFDIPAGDPRHVYYQNDGLDGKVSATKVTATTAASDSQLSDPDPDWPHSWFTIRVASTPPSISEAVVIDGYTQPGATPNTLAIGSDAVLRIELDGSLPANASGLQVSGNGNAIRGLVINRFRGSFVQDSGYGIYLNLGDNNIVEGNYLGTDVAGLADLGNATNGIYLRGATNNVIGGTTPGARNVISGNTYNGISFFLSSASNNLVVGNYIGVNAAGTAGLGNGNGVAIGGGVSSVTIGGTAAGAGNVISGNGLDGIVMAGPGGNHVIQGNLIGTDPTGSIDLGNAHSGVHVEQANNTIGGTTPAARNVISGNNEQGVLLESTAATSNLVTGNFIGTSAAGTGAVGNAGAGVALYGSASGNTIGGATRSAGNVLSANGRGVLIQQSPANRVLGNLIGTLPDGTSPLGNTYTGVEIIDANDNLIGGADSGAGNTIAFNGFDGVFVFFAQAGTGNAILGNRIFSNGGLGTDLDPNNVTPNDLGDADAGANNKQNFPVLTAAIVTASDMRIQGSLNSTPNTLFRVELFASSAADPSGNGEGQEYLGSINVTTDSAGNTTFEATVPVSVPAGQFITATATVLISGVGFGDTSEFSSAVPVTSSTGAEIHGTVWLDGDTDGIRDTSELALADRTVFLDNDNDLTLDSNEPYAVTDATGNYAFAGLDPGTYNVAEVLLPNWLQTLPLAVPEWLYVSGQTLDTGVTWVKIFDFHLNLIDEFFPDEFHGGFPTDIEIGPGGDVYVLVDDGAGVHRIVQFTYDMQFVREIDLVGLLPGPGFDVLADGNFLITSWAEHEALRLNSDGSIAETLAAPFFPWDVGTMSDGSIVLSEDGNLNVRPDDLHWASGNITELRDAAGTVFAERDYSREAFEVSDGSLFMVDLGRHVLKLNDAGFTVVSYDVEPGSAIATALAVGRNEVPYGDGPVRDGAAPETDLLPLAARSPLARTASSPPATPTGLGSWRVVIEAGQVVPRIDFGVAEFSTASGVRFNDFDGNRSRDQNEPGLDGGIIYADLDGDGVRDGREPFDITAGGGSYTIEGIPPGTYKVREEPQTPWKQTTPEARYHERLFVSGSAITDLNFGNWLGLDFGDAPPSYKTLAADHGARHAIGSGLYLGTYVDSEPDGQPTVTGDGDDANGVDDEDGVVFHTPLRIGAMVNLQVSASMTGLLNAWIDFNRDGDWGDVGEQVFSNRSLTGGPNFLSFSVPLTAVGGQTFGRFRLCSERDLTPDDLASTGEVEDYRLDIELPASIQGTKWNDLNGNGVRDAGEPGLEGWQIFLDANGNGQLDEGELSTTTDDGGDYSFVVSPGSYTVAEVEQESWLQSFPGQTQRISFGIEGESRNPAISGDGRFVAFESDFFNIVPDDTNWHSDIFVFDRQTHGVERVSVSSDGSEADGASSRPSISADGRFVAFRSNDDLVPDDTNLVGDIFVFDRQERTIERVSVNSDGAEANDNSYASSISADGQFVAFESTATNMVPDDSNSVFDIFVFDRLTRTIERVSVNSAGNQSDGRSTQPSISADGRFIAFMSEASNLVPGDSNGATDIFVFDRQARTIERVSTDSDGIEANDRSESPAISGDGRWVAFASHATNLVLNDDNRSSDIFVFDRQQGTIERLIVDGAGDEAVGLSVHPSISPDGRFVAFGSRASLVPEHELGDLDVFVFDRDSHTVRRISENNAGDEADNDSTGPAISADGQVVAFWSSASNLVPADENHSPDIFVRVLAAHVVMLGNGEEVEGLDFGNFQPEALNANDWGDAPDPYPTRAIDNGPSHKIVPGIYLGLGVDDESNGQPADAADGDDTDGNDDEDGVVFLGAPAVGQRVDIQVTASGEGLLDAWVDFNTDGDWDDEADQVFAFEPLVAGVNFLSVSIPIGAHVGPTYARFRFTGDIGFDGPAGAGEVEDYRVFVFSEQSQRDASAGALERLEQESLIPLDVRFQNGIPRFVSMLVPIEETLADNPVAVALDFLDRYRQLYRFDNPYAQLYLKRITADSIGDRHIFFGQHFDGVPVYGSSLSVHVGWRQSAVGVPANDVASLANFVLSTGGSWLASRPALPPAQWGAIHAEAIAAGNVPGTRVQVIGQSAPVYFHPGVLSDRVQSSSAETHLAWRVNLQGLRASDGIGTTWTYLIDAHDGEVLLGLDQLRTDAADEDFDIETVNNTTSSTCWNAPFVTDDDQWFDEDGEDGYPGADDDPFLDGQHAFEFTRATYEYFFENFHRHSYDGDEEQVVVHVHVGNNWRNSAYTWSGWGDCFNFGDGQAVLDVVAHEYTHAVTESTAALTYQDQSGALNESYSDVFAAMVDDDDWLIGEDRPTGYWRNMANPPDRGLPDHMLAALSGDGVGLRVRPDPTGDNGWVHTNSSIPNKVAYLISEGGVHPGSGIPVVGIRREKTAQLYYAVLSNRLGENSQFIDARDETVAQAQAFVDAGGGVDPNGDPIGFTASDVCSVINAFAAAGLDPNSADVDCDGTADNADPDDDADFVPDAADNPDDADNCISIPNPRQEDLDGDGVGDVCDPDRDGDTVNDAQDNCPTIVNTGQSDADNDGTGNACEDNDVDELGEPQPDGVFDPVDNCPNNFNPGQADNDSDGAGDVCDPDDDNDGILDDGDSSGVAGDNPCTGGDRTNCDDNAQLVENPTQSDGDSDGVGDFDIHGDPIDNCQGVANSDQADSNRDGQGDLCDSDIDGDNRPNEDDICPLVFDPQQIDRDHNGIGLACDEDEAFMLSGEGGGLLEGVLRFESPFEPAVTAIFPCLVDCPDWIPENFQTEVEISLPFAMATRIVDDRGFVVRKAAPGTAIAMRFFVAADHYSRLSALAPTASVNRLDQAIIGDAQIQTMFVDSEQLVAGAPYRGRRYFLEVLPTEQIEPGQLYLFQVRVRNRLRDIVPPTLSTVADLVVEGSSPAGAVVLYPLPVATDDADPDPTVVCTPPNGSLFPMGTTTVTCTAADDEGNASARDFLITVQDTIGPTVQELRLVATSSRITALVLTFSEQLDPATVVNPAYFQLVYLGQDTRHGTTDDRPVAIAPPVYDPSLRTVTLRPARPLSFDRFYQVTVNGVTGVTDLAGNHLNGNRTAGQDYASGFARGTDLLYLDRTDDRVSAALSRGGVLELFRNTDGEGRELRVLNSTARSRLTGSVRPSRTGSDDRTTLAALTGSAGIRNNLPVCLPAVSTRCFEVGTVSAVVVDSLLDSHEFAGWIRHHRRIVKKLS